MKKIISFPHLGDYSIPLAKFLKLSTNLEVKPAPPITKKTLELGSKYAPDSVCIPFKYNLGNFIESLDNGANILFTAGGGCRYNYYAEVTETILKDLNYNFEFYKLISKDKVKLKTLYKIFKNINKNLKFTSFIHTIIYTLLFIWDMDKIDNLIRQNIGFEKKHNSFLNLKKKMLNSFSNTTSIVKLTYLYFSYKHKFKKLPTTKPTNPLKIGIIGELYTSMEPYSNYYLEKQLAQMNIQIKRFTNLSYLIWQKIFLKKHMLRVTKEYCKYTLGADGLDNVYRTIKLIKKGYDGIIHIKPFGCTPEIGAIPIIQKITATNNTPIIFFSYDANTSDEGIKTRIEAFYDLMVQRRNHHD